MNDERHISEEGRLRARVARLEREKAEILRDFARADDLTLALAEMAEAGRSKGAPEKGVRQMKRALIGWVLLFAVLLLALAADTHDFGSFFRGAIFGIAAVLLCEPWRDIFRYLARRLAGRRRV